MTLKPLSLLNLLLSMIGGILLGIVIFQWYYSGHISRHISGYSSTHANIAAALKQIDQHFVGELDEKTLTNQAINGMLAGLDEYSELLDQQSYANLVSHTQGEFVGIGVEIRLSNGFFTVVHVNRGTPAESAGIAVGDTIRAINGTSAKGMNAEQISQQMLGAIGTNLALLLKREEQAELIPMVVQRQLITTTQITHKRLANDIGYVRITYFDQNAGANLLASLATLNKQRATKGLILDLRSNPGGILRACVDVAEIFLDGGLVVSTQRSSTFLADDPSKVDYFASTGDLSAELPLAILISEGTASASEIVAGAMQDHGRATIIGNTSFGKGTVQSLMPPLPDGQALKITTAYYYTPNGRSFHNAGIEPDITFSANEDELLEFAATHLLQEKSSSAVDTSAGE